jgi:polyisoprenoid-binding protein YceI
MKALIILAALISSLSANAAVSAKILQKLNLKPDSGSVTWKGRKFTGEHFGDLKVKSGNLIFDKGTLVKGKVVVDMNSITCTDIKSPEYNTKLIRHLKSDDFFSTQKHPYATIDIKSSFPAKGGGYEVHGNLTIKGITHPVTFKADIKDEKKHVTVASNLTFDRTKWDIRYKSKKFFNSLGDKFIYDDVNLTVNFKVKK